MRVKEIDWETDGVEVELPTAVTVPSDLEEDEIADYLSDQYGWLVNGFVMEAESFGAESKMCSYCKTTDLKNFSQGWDDYCMACARRHHREYGAESFEAEMDRKEIDTLYSYVEYLEDKCGNHYEQFIDEGLDPYRTNAETRPDWIWRQNSAFPSGTSLQGYIKTNRTELRKAFGKPNMGASDDGKVKSSSWNLIIDGKVCTIYDRREQGKRGMKYFNIGGRDMFSPLLVAQELSKKRGEQVNAHEIVPKWNEEKRFHERVNSIGEHPIITYDRAMRYYNNQSRYRAESFASYDMPISERQRYRIRKLGGEIDKAMNRSDASRYIKSLMLDIHGAESFAASDPKFGGVIAIDSMFDSENDECRVCQGFGYYFPPDNATLGQVCEHCVKGWMIEDSKDDKFKTGVKLGAGAAVGFTAVSLGFGIAAGVVGLIYQKVTGE